MSDEHGRSPDGAADDPTLREPDSGIEATDASMAEHEVEDVVFPELGEGEPATGSEGSLDRLMDVTLSVTVELGRRDMLIQDVLNLGHGSVLELDRDATAPVDVLVNGKVLARGEVVVVGDNFGVRLTSLVDGAERTRNAA
jgi:flagellar motor switch protein FliN/FliY